MRATGTTMGRKAMECQEVDLRVSGYPSTAEDFKSAFGKGDAPGHAGVQAEKSWVRRQDYAELSLVGSSGVCHMMSYLCAKWTREPGMKFPQGCLSSLWVPDIALVLAP